MTGRAELEVTLGRTAGTRRSTSDEPFRLLVLGGFSGRDTEPTARLSAQRISAEKFDAVLGRMAAEITLNLPWAPTEGVTFRPTTLDDFHPDRLLEAMAAHAPPTPPAEAPRPSESAAPPAGREDEAELLGRLLGKRPASPTDRAQQKVRALIESALGDAATPAPRGEAHERDASHTALLRALLADPQFRALERAWRSVHWLVSRLDEDQLALDIADLSKPALAEQLAAAGNRLEAMPLHALLAGREAGTAWDAIVTDYSFGLEPSDLTLLATLGALAARVPCPVLAHAELTLCGCSSASAVDAPWDWSLGESDVAQLCREVRRHPAARQLVLAAPRFLLRHPYGKRNDPIESFAFEELKPRPKRDDFVWASPAFACAHWLTQQHSGGPLGPLDDFPVPRFDDGSGEAVQPPLEVLLTERARDAAAQHGVVTLIGGRNTNQVATADVFTFAG